MADRQPGYFVQLLQMIGKIVIGGFAIIFMIVVGSAALSPDTAQLTGAEANYTHVFGDSDSSNRLLNVELFGEILGTPPASVPSPFGLFGSVGATYGYAIKKALADAAEDDAIKGIFLHTTTPGGTIFGSMAIFEGVKKYQQDTGNPVVVFVEGISASGGIMATAGADAIYADKGSLIGSIGVIGGAFLFYDQPNSINQGILGGGVGTEGGIEQTIISAGRSKDLGNPFRRLTDDEKAVLQTGVDTSYQDFVGHVAQERNISSQTIVDEMGAQVFGNKQAESYGLIDATKGWDEAILELADLAGVAEDYQLVERRSVQINPLQRLLLFGKSEQDKLAVLKESIERDRCVASRQFVLVYFGQPSALCTR